MTEICEIGKSRQQAETESMLKTNEMFDTLRNNDLCEEEDIKIKKFVKKIILLKKFHEKCIFFY